jgi:hypothetical protein
MVAQPLILTVEATLLTILVASGEPLENQLDVPLAAAAQLVWCTRGVEAEALTLGCECVSLSFRLGDEAHEVPSLSSWFCHTDRYAVGVQSMPMVSPALLEALAALGLVISIAQQHDGSRTAERREQ